MTKHVDAFLAVHTLEDIKTEVTGELLEFNTGDASYCYGNGELLIWPNDYNQDEAFVYVIDTYGDKDILVAHAEEC